jgi:hypothetical protein
LSRYQAILFNQRGDLGALSLAMVLAPVAYDGVYLGGHMESLQLTRWLGKKLYSLSM